MQLIAMITMLIDHIGFIFFPDEAVWRIIGRIAFPFYAYGIVLGYRYTSNVQKYMMRLLVLAFIAQIPFMLAFESLHLNVIFTLLISLIFITLLDKVSKLGIGVLILLTGFILTAYIPMDYGAYGLLLVIIYRYTTASWSIVLHFVLNFDSSPYFVKVVK